MPLHITRQRAQPAKFPKYVDFAKERKILIQRQYIMSKALTREQENELRKTFDDHDEDGSGAIDITEFERIAIDLGEPLSHEELQEIVKDLDKDGSGVVSYDEFIRWWRKTT